MRTGRLIARPRLKDIRNYLLVFFGLFTLLFFATSLSSYGKILRYKPGTTTVSEPATSRTSAAEGVAVSVPAASPGLVIPKISVNAPVIWNIPGERTEEYLDTGIVHMAESAQPGAQGNVVLTGHSSDYFWRHDPYATVFALLPKLAPGDEIVLTDASGKSFRYSVTKTWVVWPYDLRPVEPTDTPALTLITCYPIGTTLQRFVVRASLIQP